MNFTLDGYLELDLGATTAASDYAILLDAESRTETCMLNSSSGGALLAEQPILRLIDKVTNISIKSNSELSLNYPAESELKDLFIPIRVQLDCIDNSTNNSNCINNFYSDSRYSSLEEAINQDMSQSILFKEENDRHLFSLSTDESIISNNHIITIKFEFESRTSIELKTKQIILN